MTNILRHIFRAKNVLVGLFLINGVLVEAQHSPFFENLPVGNYEVGFKIVTLTDRSRVSKPLYDYLGEKDTTDRYRKINIHLWYPAKSKSGKGQMTYGEYCYSSLLSHTMESISAEKKSGTLENQREFFQGNFGKVSDQDWAKLVQAQFLSRKDATPRLERFPLLIGMLRAVSTSVTNEILASNGYVVAMVSGGTIAPASEDYQAGCAQEVVDMQRAIEYVSETGMINEGVIGTFGFSGSGFTQVLFAMQDFRIGALADIESGIYYEGLWEPLSASNYYDNRKLKAPFLHIFGKDMAKREKYFEEFHKKVFSDRYHLLLNHSTLNHWDLATEGRASTTVLHTRGKYESPIRASFELTNYYLLNFFNSVLKNPTDLKRLANKTEKLNFPDSLWSIQHYPAIPVPPEPDQFRAIIGSKGLDEAMVIARRALKSDSLAEFATAEQLNQLGYNLRKENKLREALVIMQFATELHPRLTWLWNNLSGMQESFGDKQEAIRSSEVVVRLLTDAKASNQRYSEKMLATSQDRIKRLKAP